MPSPTSRLRLLKQAPGSNFDSWGTQVNVGALDLADEAWGVAAIAVGDNVTLTVQNYLTDEARRLVLHLTGAGGFTVTTPAVDKPYLVVNDCSADVTITPSGGTGVTVRAGVASWVWCDGTDAFVVDTTLDKIATAADDVALGGNKLTGVADPTDAQDSATKAYVDGRRLDQAAAPTGPVSLNAQKIINLATPTAATDAATFKSVQDEIAAAATINLPSITGQAGKFLSNDGTAASWEDVPGAEVGDILITTRNPGSAFVRTDGAVYLQSAYPALFALIGQDFLQWIGTKISNPGTLPASTGNDAAWSPDGRYLAIVHDTTPFVTIYDWDSGSPVKITNPETLPTNNGQAAAWSPDGRYLAIGHITTPFVTIYDWDSGSPVKIDNPGTLPASTGIGASWSSDGRYLAIAHQTTPFVTIYDWDSGSPVKITNPSTLPTGNGQAAAWSPDGRYLAIGHQTTPFVTIYDGQAGFDPDTEFYVPDASFAVPAYIKAEDA